MRIARVCDGEKCGDTLIGENALLPQCPDQWCQELSPYSAEKVDRIRDELAAFGKEPTLCAELYEKLTNMLQETADLLLLGDDMLGSKHTGFRRLKKDLDRIRGELHPTTSPEVILSPQLWSLLHPPIIVKERLGYSFCNFYTGTKSKEDFTYTIRYQNAWCSQGENVLCADHRAWLFFTELGMMHYDLPKCIVVLCLNFIVPGYEVLDL